MTSQNSGPPLGMKGHSPNYARQHCVWMSDQLLFSSWSHELLIKCAGIVSYTYDGQLRLQRAISVKVHAFYSSKLKININDYIADKIGIYSALYLVRLVAFVLFHGLSNAMHLVAIMTIINVWNFIPDACFIAY